VEGQNVVFEWRYAEGRYDRAPQLAAELVRLNLDLIMTRGGPMTAATKRATATIPIVMWNVTDPVGIAVVANLARPGGNVTGLSDGQDPAIMGKRLQLLKQVAPSVTKVAVLSRVGSAAIVPPVTSYQIALEDGAKALGLTIRTWLVQGPDDIDRAVRAIVEERFEALLVPYMPVTWIHRRQIRDLAARHRLPAMYMLGGYAIDGGLMAYGEDEREVPQRLSVYLDKILKGAKPADLPVEQSTKFELVINLKTAKARLTIPPSFAARADQVIE
jgi:putative ABC transport system substrate-binding protein